MASRIFITGSSGFVGTAVVRELLARGYEVHALMNRTRPDALGGDEARARVFPGGLFDPAALGAGLSGCHGAVHLVGIIRERRSKGITFDRMHVEGTRAVVEACRRAGVRRLVHMSALGARPGAASTYHRTKFAAEEVVRASGLDWTIFRPSLIHGPGGEFMRQAARWARRTAPPFLFMPYFGAGLLGRGGAGRLQPVHVEDVARALVDALERPTTVGEVYPLGGPDVLTWPQLHRAVARAAVGKERAVVAIPAWQARALAAVVPGALLPFNRDQVIMSQEDNTCDVTKFEAAFGWKARAFEASLREYAAAL